MSTAKSDALAAIEKLSDDTDMDEILYRLYVVKKVREGRASADSEPTKTTEELRRDVETW